MEPRFKNQLLRGGVGSLAIQFCFAGLTFLNSFVLARLLGATGYGAFANAMAWVSLFLIPASFGFGTLLVREVALYNSLKQWTRLRGLLHFSTLWVAIVSVFLSVALIGIGSWIFSTAPEAAMRRTMWVAAGLLPFFALSQLRQGTLRGFEQVLRARIPELIVRPGVLFIALVGLLLMKSEWLSAPIVMAFNVLAAGAAFALSDFWVRRAVPCAVRAADSDIRVAAWLRSGIAMLIFSGAQASLMQTDIVMLGMLESATATGHYAIASRITYMLGYIMIAAEMVLAPIVARLSVEREYGILQNLITRAARVAFLIIAPVGIGVAYYGSQLLHMFGPGFEAVHSALVILVFGRLLEVGIGSSPLLLAMVGYERLLALGFGCAALFNVALNALFIPEFGPTGAAMASMTSLIAARLTLGVYLVKRTGIDASILNL